MKRREPLETSTDREIRASRPMLRQKSKASWRQPLQSERAAVAASAHGCGEMAVRRSARTKSRLQMRFQALPASWLLGKAHEQRDRKHPERQSRASAINKGNTKSSRQRPPV